MNGIKRATRRAGASMLMLSMLGALGCSQEVTGPAPSLPDPAEGEPSVTSPSFACNEQLESWITLTGEDFSPLVVDAIANEAAPDVEVPQITLTRSASIEGDASDEATQVVLSEAVDPEATQVRWLSDTEMRFKISPDLELPPGVYDLTVSNANGEEVSRERSFGVLPRPSVAQVVPELTCVAQGARAVTISGDHFLIQGDTLPEVGLGAQSYTPDEASDCRALDPVFGDYQVCTTLTVTVPEADLEAGRHLIEVRNGAPAGCKSASAEEDIALVITPPPTVEDILPEPLCSEQLAYDMVKITGQDFIQVGEDTLPTVTIADQTYPAEALGGCEAVEGLDQMTAQRCTELTISIPAGDLSAQLMADTASVALVVEVTNPDPVGCESTQGETLTLVPPPQTAQVQPNPVCTTQSARTITLSGQFFLEDDGELPSLEVNGQMLQVSALSDCTELDTIDASAVQSCSTAEVELPQGSLMDGPQAITLTNPAPAACQSVEMTEIVAVPPPTLTSVIEDFACNSGAAAALTLEGEGFIRTPMGALPGVTVGGQDATVLAADGCEAIELTDGFERCTSLSIEVPADTLMAGQQSIVVTNPGSTDCSSTETVEVEILPPPSVTAVQPDLFCNEDQDTTLTITGADLLVIDGDNPTVIVDGQEFTATGAANCTAVMGKSLPIESCTELSVTVPQGSLAGGAQVVEVRNPAPAACESSSMQDVFVVGPPTVTSTEPAQVCSGGAFDGQVALTGDNFLRIDGTDPTLTINGQSVTGTLSDCTMVPDTAQPTESCTRMDVVVPVALRDTDLTFRLVNPAPADCGFTEIVLPLEPTPMVTDIQPRRVCDTGSSVTVTGMNFEPGMTVTLDGQVASSVMVDANGTSAEVTFAAGLTPGVYSDLTVTNPSTCSSTFSGDIRVTDGPRVFFVDPPVVYNGINTQVTIFIAGLYGGSVTDVSIRDTAGNITPLQITFDPSEPNTVQAIIPESVLAMGLTQDTFDVIVTDDITCAGEAADILTVTDDLTVAIEQITPPFGWTNAATGVTVTATDPAPMGQSQFVATPRLYLNPSSPQPGDIATEVRSVLFNNATELSGVVDAGLPVGTYDVIVVNPDGTVGLLSSAFDVTQDAPPTIDTVSPGSWKTNEAALAVQLEGGNFRDPTVEATCKDPNGAIDVPVITRTAFTGGTIDVTVDTNTLDHLSTCVVRVTNANDGTYAEFSPVTVTNPAGNFVGFRPGTTMLEGRRAPVVAGGAPTRTAKFIYAIGGDDGTTANAKVTTEAAQLDRFGEPGPWFSLPNDLPAGRTFADAVRVEDFIYLVGGHDGAAATNTVWRANVLDPLHVPVIDNVDIDINETMLGLTEGVYYYRVSAVLSQADAANPGGETLASDPQALRAPGAGFDITVSWTALQNAETYRVYRSTAPDQPYGDEQLIAEVPASETSFVDDGTAMITMGEYPLPLGSLGKWHEVATLNTARHSHGVTAAPDPIEASTQYLYVAGGTDGATTLDSIEYLAISVNGPRDQSITPTATTSARTLATARGELSVITGSPENASYLSGAFIYFLGGKQQNGQTTREAQVGEVTAGGELGALLTTTNIQRSRAGFTAAMANNTVVAAGGQNGAPSSTADKGALCDGVACLTPEIDQWSSLGSVNMQDRYLQGDVSFNGFLYMCGGLTTGATVTNSIDYSPLGGTP